MRNKSSIKRHLIILQFLFGFHFTYGQTYPLRNYYPSGIKLYPIGQLNETESDWEMHGYTYTISGNNCGSYSPNSNFINDKLHAILINNIFNTSYSSTPHNNNLGNINWEVFNDHSCNSSESGCTNATNCSHKGIDFKASQGTSISSPFDESGKVISVKSIGGSNTNRYVGVYYEKYDFTAFFVHVKNVSVIVGSLVNKGTNIAEVGSPNHLHLEIRDKKMQYAGSSVNSNSPLNNFFDARAGFMMTNSIKLNQFISMYAGSISSPRQISFFYNSIETNGTLDTSQIFDIEIRQGHLRKTLNSTKINIEKKEVDGDGVNRQYITLNLSNSDIANFENNGKDCILTFRYNGGNSSKFFMGSFYFFNTSIFNDVSSNDKFEIPINQIVKWSLLKGYPSLNSFKTSEKITNIRAITAIVKTGVLLGLYNLNTSMSNGTFADLDIEKNPLFPFIQTYYNLISSTANTYFNPNDNATEAKLCSFMIACLGLSTADVSLPTKTTKVINFSNTNAVLNNSMNLIYKLHVDIQDEQNSSNKSLKNIWSFWDVSTTNSLPTIINFSGNNTVSNARFSVILRNLYYFSYKKKYNIDPSLNRIISNNNNISINDYTDFQVFGDIYDNADITIGNAPASVQQSYSIPSGANLRIFYSTDYDANGFPLHFYWSMKKNGATLNSDTVTHKSVTFTAPNVITPTQWEIYSYNANNKGKASEAYITINVGGAAPTNIPVPTGVFMSANSATSFVIEWDRVSTNITQYIAQYSTDPSFNSNVVTQNFNTSNATIYWTVTGQPSGTYYARVKCVQNSVEGAWSNIASLNFNADFLPAFNENAFAPINNASVSGNNVTLSFPAIGGNAPLKYTVYFADFNPLGKPPVATDITSNTFTISNLQYNQYYYWKVKVVDADGDEAWSNFYTVKINPETTPPTGSIAIENGAATTNSTSVNININVSDAQGNITAMRFSNDGVSWPEYWDAFNPTRPAWNLIGYGGNSTPGVKTVYGQFRDNSGNVATFSDNITLAAGVKGNFIVRNKKFESLRAANDYAIFGDTIFATAGYYDLTSEIHNSPYLLNTYGVGGALKNGVSLIGEGTQKTILFWDGLQAMYAGLGCAGNNIVQGLTLIVSINPNYSRAVLEMNGASNVTIKNCNIKNSNHAIECNTINGLNPSNIRIEQCVFWGNTGKSFNIRNSNNVNINNNTLNGNSGITTVMLLDNNNIVFRNNIVSNNSSEAVYIYPNTSILFTNNNIYNNRFSSSSPIENYTNSLGYLSNQTGINGNISLDPNYTNLASNIFTLNTGSPCINTGVNVGLPFNGNAPEMGAYEFGGTGTLNINSNISTSFTITKPDGTQQTVNNGQTLTNLQSGIYGIYPSQKQGYYAPNIKFMYLPISTNTNYYGYYRLDTDGPNASIYINGDAYTTQSPYVTINCEVNDVINGLQNGQMKFSNDGVNWSTTEAISNKKLLWDLSNGNNNLTAGSKVIYAKFSDKNGFWSNVINDTIEYTPSAKIRIIEPNNGVYNLDFRNVILNAGIGDILLLKDGKHGIFGGSINFPTGITFQGLNKSNTTLVQTSAITFGNGDKIDNVTMKPQSVQNFFTNSSTIPLPTILSNVITDNQNLQFSNQNLRVSNVVFKNISSFNNGFLQFYSNSPNSKLKVINNVFDASVNNPNLNAELGVNINSMCCNNTFDIRNNNFLGFDIGTNISAGAIRYINSSAITGDLVVKNNNFYNCSFKITNSNGSDISKDEFSYNYNPNFNSDYTLPINSPLLNSGSNEILYNDHNNTTNDIGITGGVYFNTPPTLQLKIEQVGALNHYKITALASDAQTPIDKLQYRWDFNSDGNFDTSFLLTPAIVKLFNNTDSITCWVFDEHFAMNYVKIANPYVTYPYTNALSVAASPNIICSGGQINVTPLINGIFAPNNQFEIQLSDNNGSFTNPITLLSFVNQANNSLVANLPLGISTSNFYKIRLKSFNPEIISNPTNTFTINASPNVAVALNRNPIGSVCTGNTIAFIANPTNGGSAPIYQWKVNGLNVGSNSNLYSSTQLKDGDIVWVELKSNASCASQTPVASTPITVNVTTIDTPFIQAIDNVLAASTDVGVQWYFNGQPINGATSQFYEATQSGNYQVRVTQNGCTVSSTVYNHSFIITGIKDNFISDNVLSIFPNPNNGTFSVKMDKAIAKNAQLAIYDVEGKVVHQQQLSNQQTDITTQNLASGVYIINIRLSENEIVKHKLVIVK